MLTRSPISIHVSSFSYTDIISYADFFLFSYKGSEFGGKESSYNTA